MMINGRPCTVEGGGMDLRLMSDESRKTRLAVAEWIRKNVCKSEQVLWERTCYGLKHALKHDTGIYVTDNQFKDAMLQAGYEPVDPNELNWHFWIEMVSQRPENSSPFYQWVRDKASGQETPEGDFAADMMREADFPEIADHDVIERYLVRHHACREAIKAFENLWRAYARENH